MITPWLVIINSTKYADSQKLLQCDSKQQRVFGILSFNRNSLRRNKNWFVCWNCFIRRITKTQFLHFWAFFRNVHNVESCQIQNCRFVEGRPPANMWRIYSSYAPATLTLFPLPWYSSITLISCIPKIKLLGQGLQKLQPEQDRQ